MTSELRSTPRRLSWLARTMGLFVLLLVVATWRLWTPQDLFPRVPFFGWLRAVPDWLDWIGLATVLFAAMLILIFGSERIGRGACLVLAAALIASISLDQHRLQPWAYQFVLIAIVLATAPPQAALFWLRVLVVGIYIHSALSKLDQSFFTLHGQQLLAAILQAVGLSLDAVPVALRPWVAAAIPLGELFVAVLLCWPRSRTIGLVGAIAMHLLLLLALGPWGMNHRPGVLLWNVFFIGQDILLFGGRGAHVGTFRLWPSNRTVIAEHPNGGTPMPLWHAIPVVCIFAAVVLPFLEPFGWLDHWPAWALYASRPERVSVFVHEAETMKLPESVRRHLIDMNPFDEWLLLRIDRWSLDALAAPIYPEDRFQIGVALAVAERFRLDTIRVVVDSPANRWTGERESREIVGMKELQAVVDEFWLNALTQNDTTRVVDMPLGESHD